MEKRDSQMFKEVGLVKSDEQSKQVNMSDVATAIKGLNGDNPDEKEAKTRLEQALVEFQNGNQRKAWALIVEAFDFLKKDSEAWIILDPLVTQIMARWRYEIDRT